VPATFADVEERKVDIGFEPKTPLEAGVIQLVASYRVSYETCARVSFWLMRTALAAAVLRLPKPWAVTV